MMWKNASPRWNSACQREAMQSASMKLESSKVRARTCALPGRQRTATRRERVLHEIVVPLLAQRDAFVRGHVHPLKAGAALHEQPDPSYVM